MPVRPRATKPTDGRPWAFGLWCILALTGCSGPTLRGNDPVLFIPGAGGDGFWHDGLRKGLQDAGIAEIRTFTWGAPPPFQVLNFQDRGIHDKAEAKLAEEIRTWRLAHPHGRLRIIAHSAGCGVALGALGRLDAESVESAILLAPSVSPAYELSNSLRALHGPIHAFHSPRDTLFLHWRTSNFGTYDNFKTPAAGNLGFDLSRLPAESRSRVIQHPWQESWMDLGNDGTHDGPLARRFIQQVIAPLLTPATPSSPRPGSSAPPGA